MKMPNGEYGRCRMHGGAAAIANWKHGRYAAQTEAERLEIAELLRQARQIMAEVGEAERQNRDPAKGAEPVDENGSNLSPRRSVLAHGIWQDLWLPTPVGRVVIQKKSYGAL